jgi:PKHD-type hydroxylase
VLLCIDHLIDEATVAKLQGWLAAAAFEDGRVTAGGSARQVKHNEQVSDDQDDGDPQIVQMQHLVKSALWDCGLFDDAALPKEIRRPLFSRYLPGMSYGTHMDNALMSDMRVDMSVTLFLSEPADYDGGELVIDFPTGARAIKLPAGSAVVYSTTELHRITEVTRGRRLAAVTWVRSFVRDAARRQILLDLKTAHHQLFEQVGKTPAVDLLLKTRSNLLRQWAED